MRRRLLIGLALAACGAIAFTATSFASGKAQTPKWKPETRTVYVYGDPASFTIVDTDGSGTTGFENLTPGDVYMGRDVIYDQLKENGGRQIGRVTGFCVVLLDERWACNGAFVLADGLIYFEGDIEHPYALTGGTGDYRNVRGEMTHEPAADFSYVKHTLTLIGVAS